MPKLTQDLNFRHFCYKVLAALIEKNSTADSLGIVKIKRCTLEPPVFNFEQSQLKENESFVALRQFENFMQNMIVKII